MGKKNLLKSTSKKKKAKADPEKETKATKKTKAAEADPKETKAKAKKTKTAAKKDTEEKAKETKTKETKKKVTKAKETKKKDHPREPTETRYSPDQTERDNRIGHEVSNQHQNSRGIRVGGHDPSRHKERRPQKCQHNPNPHQDVLDRHPNRREMFRVLPEPNPGTDRCERNDPGDHFSTDVLSDFGQHGVHLAASHWRAIAQRKRLGLFHDAQSTRARLQGRGDLLRVQRSPSVGSVRSALGGQFP